MVEKNKEYIVDIIDDGLDGQGIAKINNFTVFVSGAIKGEKIKILIVKVLTSYAYGKILEIVKKSDNRVESDCETYKRCGGCSLRHIKYEETLEIKKNIVQNLVDNNLKSKINVENTIEMKNPLHYRNKLQYPIGFNNDGDASMGVFARRSHEVIPIKKCLIQDEECEKIAKTIFNFIIKNKLSIYNEKTGKGLFRHIVIKKGFKTNEIMCILVVSQSRIPKEDELIKTLNSNFENIKTIVKNINNQNTNVIMGKNNITVHGEGYIEDMLGKYTFKISPNSFYQVNPVQTEKLYDIGVREANITKNDIVFDLYCGIGTISIYMAEYAKKVYGVEIVEQAIEDAKENAQINNINNVEFIAGDTEIILDDLIYNKKIIPNVLMVDPPRKGLDNRTIENIKKIKPDKCIYISCNPATLIRDLAKLEEIYNIKKIQPVDMFPYTSHVECCSVLELKNNL